MGGARYQKEAPRNEVEGERDLTTRALGVFRADGRRKRNPPMPSFFFSTTA